MQGSQDANSIEEWFLTILMGAFGIMASVVAYLYKAMENANGRQIKILEGQIGQLQSNYIKLEDKSDKCIQDREDIYGKMMILQKDSEDQQKEIQVLKTQLKDKKDA